MPFKKSPRRDAVSEVASIKDTPPGALEKLLKENSDLRAQLGVAEAARGAAEKAALAAAEAQGLITMLHNGVEEVPTGKMSKVRVFDHYDIKYDSDGNEVKRPVFKMVPVPTFFYKIDMPPCGGAYLRINGVEYHHGTVYKFDLDTLRTVKEMVYRLWDHDRNIHGSDENAYRPKHMNVNPRNQISARGM